MNPELSELYGSANSLVLDGVRGGELLHEGAAQQLAAAFSQFICASSQLECSYRRLQDELADLRRELARRNAALQSSMAENERIRRNLEQVVGSMPCGVLVVEGNGVISMANPESRRLLGLRTASAGEMLDLVSLSAASEIDLTRLVRFAAKDESIEEVSLPGAEKICWLEIRIRRFEEAPRCLEQGADRSIVILRDITARKRAEQERESGRRALALAEVSGEVAHEIRNPLASLELFAELIEQDEAQRATWISHLRAGIRSLSATVNNVLSLRSGTFKLDVMNLPEAVEDALRFAQPLLAQAELAVEWKASAADPYVLGSAAAVQQIVLNLVSNAIRHTPAGGRIEVSLLQDSKTERGVPSEWLVLEFADSGSGLPAGQVDRLFEPGFSGSGTTSGLGLAVCERIMREHGGTIRAGNRNGGGARFTLAFPVCGKGAVAA